MRRRFLAVALLALACFIAPGAAYPATYTIKLGPVSALTSFGVPTPAQSYLGTGSWYKQFPPAPKFETYINVPATFGTTFTVGQIASISYHTLNNATNPSNVDFYLVLYTAWFSGGNGSWYGRRLTGENIYANNYGTLTAGVWNTWRTDAGPRQLTFYDSFNCGNFGFYGAPTLADLQAGPFNWSTWGANPTAGSSNVTPIDYATQPVSSISFQTGSGWSSFQGWLDDLTVNLTNGDSYIVDFEAPAEPLYVDIAWPATTTVGVEIAPGRWFGYNAFHYVQNAIDMAIPGGTVNVAAGVYEEQLVINGKNLTLKGAGAGLTTVKSPNSLPTQFTVSGQARKPVVAALNAADVRIEDLTVDGFGRGNGNLSMVAIAYYEAGGRVRNAAITRVRETPMSGGQHGVGLYAYNVSGGPYSLEVDNVVIDDFQKNAMALSGNGLTVNVHDCTATGSGPTPLLAQNGIQVGFGAQGTVANCAISSLIYSGTSAEASGLLIYQPGGPIAASGLTGANALTHCQAPVNWYDGGGSITGIQTVGGSQYAAVFVYNSSAGPSATRARSAAPGNLARAWASPFDESGGSNAVQPSQLLSSYDVAVQNGCLNGSDAPASVGVYALSNGGPLSVRVQDCEISDWDYGLYADGAAVTLTPTDNSIGSNVTAGYDNTASGAAQLAERNWWGHASGPGGAGGGSGDAVLPVVAANVDFSPWLVTGDDAQPGCGFAPGPDNVIAAGPAPGCITPGNSCVTIPVSISRTTSEDLRGFSVDVTLSGNLSLCGAITEGTYLSGIGATGFQVYGSGPTYTVDGAILGIPCGATGSGGLLFNLAVTSSSPSGTGTITVSNVTLRDCANVPIPGSAGGPLTITIDNVVPGALTLSAAQVKVGNDADGTTRINVSWPSAPVLDTVLVYRAGFGNYPEYDDVPGAGSVPAAPSYPPPSPWQLAGKVVGGTLFADESTARDFWYYVAFVKDPCGSVGAVSNRTGGTLNYHLGDVAALGDNQVATIDVAALGLNYGITLGASDPLGYLDVGPTTDYSVDARPTTDNKVQFEDLMMFAINYGVVFSPQNRAQPMAAGETRLRLATPAAAPTGGTFDVGLELEGAGDVKGFSVELAWNPAVVEPVAVEPGELLSGQAGQAVAYSSAPGNVDLAVFGTGIGFLGSGEAARVTFRVIGSGDPAIALRSVDARDLGNRRVALGTLSAGGAATPSRTQLGRVAPNPFRGFTTVHFALRQAMPVSLDVYDVGGRRVRTLFHGLRSAGPQWASWDGNDDAGLAMASGFYVIRMEADGRMESRQVRLVR